MSTELKVYVNNDSQDLPLDSSGVDWTELNIANDYLVFSAGSDIVKDGEAIPSASELNQAGVIITTSKVIVPKYFLADISDSLLKEIHNAGDNNKRYVFAFSFEGATASEPVLEVWDDSDMNSIESYTLGNETASNSWIYGITTTDGLPGANWIGDTPTVGSRLAGSSDGHFLWLNNENGALSGAGVLYCQLKLIVPANAPYSGAETPLFTVKYTTN